MKKAMVINSTILILLSKVNRLDLLNVVGKLTTIPEVQKEVFGSNDIPSIERGGLIQFFEGRINMESSYHETNFGLGLGESSAIYLAVDKKTVFVSDDKKARKLVNSCP